MYSNEAPKLGKQLFFVFFAKADGNGLIMRAFLTLDAAKEDCATLEGFVTCIVPVAVDETYWWNGKNKTEVSVRDLGQKMVRAVEMIADGTDFDQTAKAMGFRPENDRGLQSMGEVGSGAPKPKARNRR